MMACGLPVRRACQRADARRRSAPTGRMELAQADPLALCAGDRAPARRSRRTGSAPRARVSSWWASARGRVPPRRCRARCAPRSHASPGMTRSASLRRRTFGRAGLFGSGMSTDTSSAGRHDALRHRHTGPAALERMRCGRAARAAAARAADPRGRAAGACLEPGAARLPGPRRNGRTSPTCSTSPRPARSRAPPLAPRPTPGGPTALRWLNLEPTSATSEARPAWTSADLQLLRAQDRARCRRARARNGRRAQPDRARTRRSTTWSWRSHTECSSGCRCSSACSCCGCSTRSATWRRSC